MKKLIFGLFIIITVHQISFSQSGWFQQTSGTNVDLYSIYFVNSNTGYATGYVSYPNLISVILKTTNSGVNWVNIKQDTLKFLSSIFFVDENSGYVVGDSPIGAPILKTTDGGVTWSTQYMQTNMLYSVYFIDSNTGFIAGKYGVMLNTSNSGANWIMHQISYHDLFSVNFININTGYSVGGGGIPGTSGTIYKTTNCGLNWIDQSIFNSNFVLQSISFPNQNTGYTEGHTGSQSAVLKTINGGANWIINLTNDSLWFNYLYFTNELTGYTIGNEGLIIKTTNGCGSFTNQNSNVNRNLYSIFFTDNNTGYIVGQLGTILKTTNGGEPIGIRKISSSSPGSFKLFTNYPNPFNPSTKIKFDIPLSRGVPEGRGVLTQLTIFDILGREVTTLVNEQLKPGSYEVEWNGSNYASGIYFYTLKTDNFSGTRKMILMK